MTNFEKFKSLNEALVPRLRALRVNKVLNGRIQQSLGTANAAYTFTGMAKGDIEVVVSKKSTKKSIVFT